MHNNDGCNDDLGCNEFVADLVGALIQKFEMQ